MPLSRVDQISNQDQLISTRSSPGPGWKVPQPLSPLADIFPAPGLRAGPHLTSAGRWKPSQKGDSRISNLTVRSLFLLFFGLNSSIHNWEWSPRVNRWSPAYVRGLVPGGRSLLQPESHLAQPHHLPSGPIRAGGTPTQARTSLAALSLNFLIHKVGTAFPP